MVSLDRAGIVTLLENYYRPILKSAELAHKMDVERLLDENLRLRDEVHQQLVELTATHAKVEKLVDYVLTKIL